MKAFFEAAKTAAQKTKTTRVIRFFPDSDLRCAHEGLRAVARKEGFDPWELKPGEFLVFANRRLNRLKVYAPGNILAHLKSPNDERLDLDLVRLLPRFFNGTAFEMNQALQTLIHYKTNRKGTPT